MATITFTPYEIEQMLQHTADVEVTAFTWDHNAGNQPDIDFCITVNQPYKYETDELVSIEEYQELEDNHAQMKEDYDNLVVELEHAKNTIVTTNKILTDLLVDQRTSKWAFWKK